MNITKRAISSVLAGWISLVGLTACANADPRDIRIDRAEAAFETWLQAHDLKGAIALRHADGTHKEFGFGQSHTAPAELASVSKSITALCVAELVARDQMDWPDTVTEIVGRGPEISLSTLITHASGLVQDATQQDMRDSFGQATAHRSDAILQAVIERGGPAGKLGAFSYNNENYALLGVMIEAASGRAYSDVCAELVMAPAGVAAHPSPVAAGALPWGGWVMSVADYAKLHAYWFGAARNTGTDPLDAPHVAVSAGVYYGLGTFFRTLERGNTFWHFGALCFPGENFETGSFAGTIFGEWTWTAVYDGCVDWDAMFELDDVLVRALFGALE